MQNHFLLFMMFLAAVAIVSFIYAMWRGRNDEQILRSIIENSPIPTFVISTDHKILYWNKALESLSGIKAESVMHTTGSGWHFTNRLAPACLTLF